MRSVIRVLACALVACSGSSAKRASVVAAPSPAPAAPVVKETYPCIQLHADIDTIMKDARYQWRAGGESGEGVTHTSWVVIKTARAHPDRASLSWGPLLDGGDAAADFPFATTVYFETSEDAGTPEQRARRMLRDLGFEGALELAVTRFQISKNLSERGLIDGHVPPKTWALLQAIFKDTQDDKTAPPECED